MPIWRTIRRVVLTGFMGAGKSTIGPLLAQSLGWDFLDTDTAIQLRTGRTIAEIFADQGEVFFRELEEQAVRDCARRERLVLALGGGALECAATRALLASLDQTCVLFLDAPFDLLVSRCLAQTHGAERPVLADRERLEQRFNARLPYYRAAHLTVPTAGLPPQEVTGRILETLKLRCTPEDKAEGIPTR